MLLYIFIEHVMYIMTFDFVKKKKNQKPTQGKSKACHVTFKPMEKAAQ